jgi:hypothetical protein
MHPQNTAAGLGPELGKLKANIYLLILQLLICATAVQLASSSRPYSAPKNRYCLVIVEVLAGLSVLPQSSTAIWPAASARPGHNAALAPSQPVIRSCGKLQVQELAGGRPQQAQQKQP